MEVLKVICKICEKEFGNIKKLKEIKK